MVDFQTAFNVLLGAFSGLAGWLMNNLYQAMRDLARADEALASKVNSIEVLVAGKYLQRVEFDSKLDMVFHKLESIEDKLDKRLSSFKSQ